MWAALLNLTAEILVCNSACLHGCFFIYSFPSSFNHYTKSTLVCTHYTLLFSIYIHMHTLYAIIYSHTHTHAHTTIYSLITRLITHSFYHFLQQMIIVAIGLVAGYDFIEDSVGIALKLHNFILTFHCSVYHSR